MTMDDSLPALGEHIREAMPDDVGQVSVSLGELCLPCRRDGIARVMKFLRDDPRCRFRVLIDICGVDHPGDTERFEVVYHLLSMTLNHRIRVKLRTGDEPVPGISHLFPAANWFEREAFDLYGILFSGHPDLRRLLTDYDFDGHPLRKDFPLTGYEEVRYDDEQKRVVHEPVSLPQEFRSFDFESPWEGPDPVLPGVPTPKNGPEDGPNEPSS